MSLATLKKKCKAKSNLSGSSKKYVISLVKSTCCCDDDFTDSAAIFSITGKRTNNIIGKSMSMSQKSNTINMNDNIAKYTVPNSSSNKKCCGTWVKSNSFSSESHRLQYLRAKSLVNNRLPYFSSQVIEGEYVLADDNSGTIGFSLGGIYFEDLFGLSIPICSKLVKVYSQIISPNGTFDGKVQIQFMNQTQMKSTTCTFEGPNSYSNPTIPFKSGDIFNLKYVGDSILPEFTRFRFTLLFEQN